MLLLDLHTGFLGGKVVWYSHLFKNFPQFFVIHTVKGFSIVNKADFFFQFPCLLYDPWNVGNLISDASTFSKPNLYILKYFLHMLLKPNLKNFEYNLTSMWNEHNSTVVWTFFYFHGLSFDLYRFFISFNKVLKFYSYIPYIFVATANGCIKIYTIYFLVPVFFNINIFIFIGC